MVHQFNKNNLGIQLFASFGVALFFAPFLSMSRGYTAGLIVLMLSGIYYLLACRPYHLTRQDRLLISLFLIVGLAGILSAVYHGSPLREWDMPSRFILVTPVIMMLIAYPPKPQWIWCGLIVGCLSGAGMAFWDVYSLQLDRGFGYTGAIQFGNVALVMAVFCAAGLFEVRSTIPWASAWRAALVLGAIAGLGASVISGSRGGWVALPAVVVLFCVALVNKKNIKAGCVVLCAVVLGTVIVVSTVPSVTQRYHDAISDIRLYKQGQSDTSLGARFAIWESTIQLIQERPLLGWSREARQQRQNEMIQAGEADPVVNRLANTHNTFLEVLLFQGLFGFLSIVALLCGAFVLFCMRLRSSDYSVRMAALSGACLISIYVISSQTQIMYSRNNTLVFFLIACAVFWAKVRQPTRCVSKAAQRTVIPTA